MWQYPNPDWTIYAPHFSILLAVVKMHCLYANAVVQPSVQHYSCYMAWKTKDHTWCRYCHLCINAPMWREKRWLQGIIDPPSYLTCMNTAYRMTHLYANEIYGRDECHPMILVSWIETFIFMRGVIIQMKSMKWCNYLFNKYIPLIKCKIIQF